MRYMVKDLSIFDFGVWINRGVYKGRVIMAYRNCKIKGEKYIGYIGYSKNEDGLYDIVQNENKDDFIDEVRQLMMGDEYGTKANKDKIDKTK